MSLLVYIFENKKYLNNKKENFLYYNDIYLLFIVRVPRVGPPYTGAR